MQESPQETIHPVALFYSYAPEDEVFRLELEKHLSVLRRRNVISEWHNRRIIAGTDWSQEIDSHLNNASIILLLISADFLGSDYCYHGEMQRALERHRSGEARVIPIILRPVDWAGAPFAHLQCLPHGGTPVTQWYSQDVAFRHIAESIRIIIENLSKQNATQSERVLLREEDFLKSKEGSTESELAGNEPLVLDDPVLAKMLALRPRFYDGRRFRVSQGYLGISSLNFDPPETISLSHFHDHFLLLLSIKFSHSSQYAGFAALMPILAFEPLYQAYMEEKDHRKICLLNVEGYIKHYPVSLQEGMLVLLVVETCQIIVKETSET